jgi:hypothetical protein
VISNDFFMSANFTFLCLYYLRIFFSYFSAVVKILLNHNHLVMKVSRHFYFFFYFTKTCSHLFVLPRHRKVLTVFFLFFSLSFCLSVSLSLSLFLPLSLSLTNLRTKQFDNFTKFNSLFSVHFLCPHQQF